jgi:hypothetical protein
VRPLPSFFSAPVPNETFEGPLFHSHYR